MLATRPPDLPCADLRRFRPRAPLELARVFRRDLFIGVGRLDGPPTAADLGRLPVTRQTLAEAMRLFPPAWAIGRESVRDIDLGGRPVPRGAMVLFAPLFLHRDPRVWDAPEAFRPERSAPDGRAGRHTFASLPFSAGRRGCIGEQFAWMEGTLVLATFTQRWRLGLAGPPPAPHGSGTLRPDGPPWLTTRPRTARPTTR